MFFSLFSAGVNDPYGASMSRETSKPNFPIASAFYWHNPW